VNALANPEVGKYLNEHFVAAFQKVGTFRIVGQQKQGGNVASYFCAQDGRVLHVIAGPVDAPTLLREARWVVETVKKSLAETEKNGKSFKAQFRQHHAERLLKEHHLTVQPVLFDSPSSGVPSALTFRDPTGNTLAPVLPPVPIDGPDVSLTPSQAIAFNAQQDVARKVKGANIVVDRSGRRWVLNNPARVHTLLAAHSMKKIETIYGSIFENILGEKISTKPIVISNPFPWVKSVPSNLEPVLR